MDFTNFEVETKCHRIYFARNGFLIKLMKWLLLLCMHNMYVYLYLQALTICRTLVYFPLLRNQHIQVKYV